MQEVVGSSPIFSTKSLRTFEVQQLTNFTDDSDAGSLENGLFVSGDASKPIQMAEHAMFTAPILHKADSEWYIDFYYRINGKQKRFKRSDGINSCKDEKEKLLRAEQLILKYHSQLQNGWNPLHDQRKFKVHDHLQYQRERKAIADPDHNLLSVFNEYINDMKEVVKLRDKSISTYLTKLRMFRKWMSVNYSDNISITRITREMCMNFASALKTGNVTGKTVEGRTFNSYIASMRALWNWYDEKYEYAELINHWRKIKPAKKIQKRKHPYTVEQQSFIFNHLSEKNMWQLWLICQLIFRGFVRPGREIHGLKVSDIDFVNNKIWLRSDISKNKKTQSIPLPSIIKEKLIEMGVHVSNANHFIFGKTGVSETPSPRGWWSKQYTKIFRPLGLPAGQTIYTWKDTGNQIAHMNGMPPKQQQDLNRHHSLDQMLTYLAGLKPVEQKEHDNYFK